ncbi:sulfite exporter TauE/SafE family protein [Jatrophihabitans sp. YIM 134969]
MPSLDPGDVAALVGAGLAGGFVNAVAGGGSLIVFPVMVASGLGTVPANVTNSVALWPGYIGNVASLRDQIAEQWRSERRRILVMCALAVLGSIGGAVLLLVTPDSAFDAVVPVLVIGATLLLGFGPRIKARLGHGVTRDGALGTAVVLASAYGGYFGGGLGVILLAVLGLTYAGGIRAQNALKALLQIVVSTASLLVFVVGGPVDWAVVGVVAPAALVGGYAGGRMTRMISETWLRRVVVVFGLAVGIWLAVRAVRNG